MNNDPTLSGHRHDAALVLYNLKWSDRRIGLGVGVTQRTVHRWRARHGLPAHFQCKPIDHDRALALHAQGWNDGEISRELNVNTSGICRWRARHGLARNAEQFKLSLIAIHHERVKKLLLAKMSSIVLARVFECDRNAIRWQRDKLGNDPRLLQIGERLASAIRPRYPSGRPVPNLSSARQKAAFIAWADGLSDGEIATAAATSRTRIVAWRRRYNLPANRIRGRTLNAGTARPVKPAGPAITPHRDDLYSRIAKAVGNHLAPDVAADIISEIYVAVLAGELQASQIEIEARRFGNRFVGMYASQFGPRSLDEHIGDDGWTLAEMIADPRTDFLFDMAMYRGFEARRAAIEGGQ